MIVVLLHAIVPRNGKVLIFVDEPVYRLVVILGIGLLLFCVWYLVAHKHFGLLLEVAQESILLLLSQIGRRLDHVHLNILEVTCELVESSQDVAHHEACTGSKLYEVDCSQLFGNNILRFLNLVVLKRHHEPNTNHLTEHLRDFGTRRKITSLIENLIFCAVVSVLRMHQGHLHKPSQTHGRKSTNSNFPLDGLVQPLYSFFFLNIYDHTFIILRLKSCCALRVLFAEFSKA